MQKSYRIGNHIWRFSLLLATLMSSGCISLQASADPDRFSYRYLSIDFSGKGWDQARHFCAERGKLVYHLGTDCGFFICTTSVSCRGEPSESS